MNKKEKVGYLAPQIEQVQLMRPSISVLSLISVDGYFGEFENGGERNSEVTGQTDF